MPTRPELGPHYSARLEEICWGWGKKPQAEAVEAPRYGSPDFRSAWAGAVPDHAVGVPPYTGGSAMRVVLAPRLVPVGDPGTFLRSITPNFEPEPRARDTRPPDLVATPSHAPIDVLHRVTHAIQHMDAGLPTLDDFEHRHRGEAVREFHRQGWEAAPRAAFESGFHREGWDNPREAGQQDFPQPSEAVSIGQPAHRYAPKTTLPTGGALSPRYIAPSTSSLRGDRSGHPPHPSSKQHHDRREDRRDTTVAQHASVREHDGSAHREGRARGHVPPSNQIVSSQHREERRGREGSHAGVRVSSSREAVNPAKLSNGRGPLRASVSPTPHSGHGRNH